MKLKKFADLTTAEKDEARRSFVHWHNDTTSKTFEEWAGKHAFYTLKAGGLSHKHKYCEPSFLAE
jgi:hypothetical protein